MDMPKRIAYRHLQAREPASDQLDWGLDKIQQATDLLREVVDVWESRPSGGGEGFEAVVDVYGPAAKVVKELRGTVSKALANHIKALKPLKR